MILANEAALHNFLSPFSGTHWVQPRSYQAQVGWAFYFATQVKFAASSMLPLPLYFAAAG